MCSPDDGRLKKKKNESGKAEREISLKRELKAFLSSSSFVRGMPAVGLHILIAWEEEEEDQEDEVEATI